MSCLFIISGVAGMTGSELAKLLINQKHTVIGFDNFFASSIKTIKEIKNNKNFIFHEFDINNVAEMLEIKSEVLSSKERFEKLIYINCAAIVHTEHFYHIDRTFETNVLGMKSFLDQAISVNSDIYINCSTSEVYSMQSWKAGGVKESDFITMANAEHSQRTSYATGKLLTEFFMKDAVDNKKIRGCSLRFANVYSKNELYPKHIIPHILTSLKNNNEVELLENSKINKRTFLHNIDSCMAVIELIKEESALDGTVYNVATDEEISIIDLVKLCAKKLGIENPKIIFNGHRDADPERRVLNTEKIRTKTKWIPLITLEKGIEMCISEKSYQ